MEPGGCRKGTRERVRGGLLLSAHTSPEQVEGKVGVVPPPLRRERLHAAETPRARRGRRADTPPPPPALRGHTSASPRNAPAPAVQKPVAAPRKSTRCNEFPVPPSPRRQPPAGAQPPEPEHRRLPAAPPPSPAPARLLPAAGIRCRTLPRLGPAPRNPPDLSGEVGADTQGCCLRPPSQGSPRRRRNPRAGHGHPRSTPAPGPCSHRAAALVLRGCPGPPDWIPPRTLSPGCAADAPRPRRALPAPPGPSWDTAPALAAFPPSALRTHPSARMSPLVPPAIPPFCPFSRPLPGPAVPPAPQPLCPDGPPASPGCGGGGGGCRVWRGAGSGPARAWHSSPGSPLSRGAASD